MRCFNCGAELTKDDRCPNCGIDVKINKKILMVSEFYYNQGLERAGVRDLSGAADSLRKSLRFHKANTKARNLLGLVLFEMGEAVSAMGEWVISKSLEPENNEAEKYLDKIQKNKVHLDMINQTIKKYNQALLYCRQDSRDLAIIQLKKVLSLNPKLVKGHQLLALLYMQEGQYAQAKKSLRAAGRIDSSNTLTLRCLKETNQALHAENSGKKKKKEDDLISYRSGNDLIIQPTKFKDTSGFATIVSILLGVGIGVAVTCFLIVPSIRQNAKSDANQSVLQANDTIATKNQEIANLESEMDDLNRQIADAQTATQQDADRVLSYEQLIIACQALENQDITAAGDALTKVNEEQLSEAVKPVYESINTTVNAQYLQAAYADGYAAYNNGNYEDAVTNLEKVTAIDEAYEDGNAIYYLAQSYRQTEQNDKAIEFYKKVVEGYPNTTRASNAQRYLEELEDV